MSDGMTMIERMARAMSHGAQTRLAPRDLLESDAWQAHREDQVSREWHHYVPFVRDMLGAMREPTVFMTIAGDTASEPYYPEVAPTDVEWRAMIDAALFEQP